MEYATYFPFWSKLEPEERLLLSGAVQERCFEKGTVIHNGSEDCIGLLVVTSGQLRAYTLSEEGRELTLYRLFERDMCLLSASCMLRGIDFDIVVAAETDAAALHVPPDVYKTLMDRSMSVAAYTNELLATRFSDVMWLMDQVLNKKLDARLAALLVEEAALAESTVLAVTHEQLARHLGSVREVITRMLKYLQNDGLVHLTRGSISILDMARLRALAGDSLR